MNQSGESIMSAEPTIVVNKNLVYKGKEYPIDFRMMKKYSNFFYSKRKFYKNTKNIGLQIGDFEISEESIPIFIACCQNQPFDITDSTVFSLHHLSFKYEVPVLIEQTNEYIKKNLKKLVFQSISYKLQNRQLEANFDLSEEEETIATYFSEYINDERLLSLPVRVLYRIINNNHIEQIDSNQFTDFLFKCLDKYKCEASILFANLDLENNRIGILSRLINDYSDVLDFTLIDPKFLMKTSTELLNELKKMQIEYSNKISEINSFQQKFVQLNKMVTYELAKINQEQRKNQDMQQIENQQIKEKLEEQSKVIEKLSKRQVTGIKIDANPKYLIPGQSTTLTATVITSDDGIEWHVIPPNTNSIEVQSINENKLNIKCLSFDDKITVIATSKDRSDITEVKELLFGKIEGTLDIRVQQNKSIEGTIKLTEKGVTLDTSKSKYVLNTSDSPVLGEGAYDSGFAISSLNQHVSFNEQEGTYFLHALLFDNFGNSSELVSEALVMSGMSPLTFDYQGRVQSVELDKGSYKLEVWGAQGGSSSYARAVGEGGRGGYSCGTISLPSRTKIFVYVGGQGVARMSEEKVEGGFNGGGYSADERNDYEKGVGGGGTDIRVKFDSLYARVIVAGGGGGGTSVSKRASSGGPGGGPTGGKGAPNDPAISDASGGTQFSGGLPGKPSSNCFLKKNGLAVATGGFGAGGSVSSETYNTMAGAGGGGWYGGGAGNGHGGVGGGGSGWIFNERCYNEWKMMNPIDAVKFLLDSTYYLSDAVTVGGDIEFQSAYGDEYETGHCGNGYARITPL